jgi:hypothetical protein
MNKPEMNYCCSGVQSSDGLEALIAAVQAAKGYDEYEELSDQSGSHN